MGRKGVLLVNLGTPDSAATRDVYKYLTEFLMDGRVIDIPRLNRTLLVKGIIVPFRSPNSAKLYRAVWDEKGSPLLYHSVKQKELLQERLGSDYLVSLGMRYQNPSIKLALDELRAANVESIKVIPMFPQYASATTGSVMQAVMEVLCGWQIIPPVVFVNSFYSNERIIKVFADNALKHGVDNYDHVLFSFHGLPVRQLYKYDYGKGYERITAKGGSGICEDNQFCYEAQCYATATLIADRMQLPPEKYTVCFQSRLGKEPWIEPFTSDVLHARATAGDKKLLVFSPAFVADCLETLHEIGVEYAAEFKALGGEEVQLVESLNEDALFIEALALMAADN